jgi:hypothetical protein
MGKYIYSSMCYCKDLALKLADLPLILSETKGAMMSTFAASLTALLAYATLSRSVNSAAHVIGVKSNIGWQLVGIVSAATLCSLSSTMLWFLHVCCCNNARHSRYSITQDKSLFDATLSKKAKDHLETKISTS